MNENTKNPAQYIRAARADYETRSLDESSARRDPFEQFEVWLGEAIEEYADEANAMVLTTAARDCKTSSRVVLLRGYDRRGFVFYTNYDSQKGSEIAENPHASLLFFWARLERQIRIEGAIAKTSRAESEAYFATRPRASQIGAWASAQSRPLGDRRQLEDKIVEIERRFAGREVECPEFWGGYRVEPNSFEFWQGRKSRLHDRLRYARRASIWTIERLSP